MFYVHFLYIIFYNQTNVVAIFRAKIFKAFMTFDQSMLLPFIATPNNSFSNSV